MISVEIRQENTVKTMNNIGDVFLVVTDSYQPINISASIQMTDLANELARRGQKVVVITPSLCSTSYSHDPINANLSVLRVKCPKAKDRNYLFRVVSEFMMPFLFIHYLKKNILYNAKISGVIWYSPSIFFGPLISWVKNKFDCPAYLILRDLFPDWAVDAGVMRKGLAYWILKQVESYQYRQADVIGVQTPANLPHLAPWDDGTRRIEVLPNWLAPARVEPCSLDVSQTKLSGRRIFVYAGNMGVAQDMKPIIDMAVSLREFRDWGFLFVGRGSETEAIRQRIAQESLDNVLLCDEIQPQEIPGLFTQCHIGIVALDPRHTTHNIPGKFVAYMRSGLPVLARINKGNDLRDLIHTNKVGIAVDEPGQAKLQLAALELIALTSEGLSTHAKAAKDLWAAQYSAEACAGQVLDRLGK